MMEERERHDEKIAEECRQREVQLAKERQQRDELLMRLVEKTACHDMESGNRAREQTSD